MSGSHLATEFWKRREGERAREEERDGRGKGDGETRSAGARETQEEPADNQPESCSLFEKGVVSMANNRTTSRPRRKHHAWRITGSRVRLG
ncbi:hypothetical protein H8959_019439 [Pygathrix nigripes]